MHVIKRSEDWKKIVRTCMRVCVRAYIWCSPCVYDFTARCVWFADNKKACCQLQYIQFIRLPLSLSLSLSLTREWSCLSLSGPFSQHNFCRTHMFYSYFGFVVNITLILIEFLMIPPPSILNSLTGHLHRAFCTSRTVYLLANSIFKNARLGRL